MYNINVVSSLKYFIGLNSYQKHLRYLQLKQTTKKSLLVCPDTNQLLNGLLLWWCLQKTVRVRPRKYAFCEQINAVTHHTTSSMPSNQDYYPRLTIVPPLPTLADTQLLWEREQQNGVILQNPKLLLFLFLTRSHLIKKKHLYFYIHITEIVIYKLSLY